MSWKSSCVHVIGLLMKEKELLFYYVIDVAVEVINIVIDYRVRTEWPSQETLTYILLQLIL